MKKGYSLILFIFMVIVVGMLIYTDQNSINIQSLLTKDDEIIKDIKYEGESIKFMPYKEDYIKCSNDNIKRIGLDDKEYYNYTYSLKEKTIDKEGNYIAVSEFNSNNIYVFDESGLAYEIKSKNNILKFKLNKNGFLGVICKEVDGHKFYVYDNKGQNLFEKPTLLEKEGYPTDITISNDNRILGVSYVDTNVKDLKSKIVLFFIYEEDGKDYLDNLLAGYEYEGVFIYNVNFMNEGIIVAFSDKKIISIDSKTKEKLYEDNLHNKIGFYFVGDDYYVYTLGEETEATEEDYKNNVIVKDINGKDRGRINMDSNITYLYGDNLAFIVGCNNHYYGYTNKTKELWDINSLVDLNDIYFLNDNYKIMKVYNNSIEIMKIRR